MKWSADAISIVFLACWTIGQADKFLEAGTARVNSEEVQQQFNAQLRTMLGQGDAADMSRLMRLQSLLEPLYAAMPRSADGGLEHGAARYVLHRFFAQQHGWHVRGLEATGSDTWNNAESSTSMLEDHIPSYVLKLFEQSHGGRTGVRELAVLAATLEDVVHSETINLLSTAYAAQSTSVWKRLTVAAESRIAKTYLLFHLLPMPQYAALTTVSLNRVLDKAPTFWSGWEDTVMWMHDLRGAMDYHEASGHNPFVNSVVSHDFNSLVRWLESVGEHYGKFQTLECRGMKNALLDLSDGSGRVRLAKFYQAAFENRTSHFTESPDYLRHLGVLDDTDPRQPTVIVTNYLYARANCLASSSLYSICCLDECEALMAQLERKIANPLAAPQMVAELVATMSSDTVSAPRNISEPMRRRLDDIAGRHAGNIPLHGRLFAQWMHHAFPNECSYPHVTGSLESPVNPMEWMLTEEETGRNLKASMEEMQSAVDAALSLNASDPLAAAQAPPLPWTEDEELMIGGPVARPMGMSSPWLRSGSLVLAVVSAVIGLIKMLGPVVSPKGEKGRSLSTRFGGMGKTESFCV